LTIDLPNESCEINTLLDFSKYTIILIMEYPIWGVRNKMVLILTCGVGLMVFIATFNTFDADSWLPDLMGGESLNVYNKLIAETLCH
jgi:hypothetical protein